MFSKVVRAAVLSVACFAVPTWQTPAAAQTFPDKPVRMIVGFSAGGIADVVSRVVAQYMSTDLGQPVIVDNKPGADGQIALGQLAAAAPNGYTIGLADSGLAVNTVMYSNKAYDPLKDFTPLLSLGEVPNFIAVNPSVKANTLGEFIALAKANPGKMNYAATASSTWLATELLNSTAGINLVRIPYKGQAQGLPALMAGDVQLIVSAVGPLAPLAKEGKLRPLAVSASRRTWLAPDVPTTAEAGLPGMVYVNWYVILAPANMPRPVSDRLSASLRKVMADPAVIAKFKEMGIEPNPLSAAEFTAVLKSELTKMEGIVKTANIKVE